MVNKLALKCADLNSPYCPCLLSDTNHCFFCSHLQGKSVCGCNWSGVCAFYEKKWRPQTKIKQYDDLGLAAPVRLEVETKFTVVNQICANTYEIEFGVSAQLAAALQRAGSFVFLRQLDDQQFYFFPVGVMAVTGNLLRVVIKTSGTKSTRLLAGGNQSLLVKGPYCNGVFGQPWVENMTEGKILLVAGGLGQAAALPLAARLTRPNTGNNVSALLAPGSSGKIFIKERLENMGVKVAEVASMRRWGLNMVKEIISDAAACPDLIVSAGPDEQHYAVIAAMQPQNIPLAATNNNTMCCGEGVCGSCERKTKSGQKIRTCKAQVDFKQLEPRD
ncbi:MAG: hypothetical protein LBR56_04070 [Sporomusaceae bacterium]|jgi:NAD(P)H-flavin reductase|nr:hypothetical protein [Sporomusaceae bacterium]